jgi:type IV secretion system protein VirD4
VAKLRVDALVAAAQTGRGADDPDHWRAGAARILRPYFLAAACHPLRSGDLGVVRRWLAAQEVAEPVSVLRGLDNTAGYQWAAELQGVANTPDRERGSFYSAAETTLAATSDPRVLDSCSMTELDLERLLLTRSTLYVVSQTEDQKAVAPLISALIESVVTTAYQFHRQRQLGARLLLSLDEFANIAPLPNVESIVSQGAGQGVNIVWAAQSLAQLRHRYGEHAAEAIWSATTAKLVFGGLADHQLLERISNLVGDREVRTRSKTWVAHANSAIRGTRQITTSMTWRQRLPVADLRKLRPGWALLLYHHHEPYCLRVPIAQYRRLFRRALLPWVAPTEEPERPHLEVVHGERSEGTEDVGA